MEIYTKNDDAEAIHINAEAIHITRYIRFRDDWTIIYRKNGHMDSTIPQLPPLDHSFYRGNGHTDPIKL